MTCEQFLAARGTIVNPAEDATPSFLLAMVRHYFNCESCRAAAEDHARRLKAAGVTTSQGEVDKAFSRVVANLGDPEI